MKGLTKNADRDTLHIGENESQNIILRRNGIMNKKLLIAAAIAFAVFAVPCGNNALATVSVASENNTVASENNTVKPTPAPTSTPAPTVDVNKVVDSINKIQIQDAESAKAAKDALKGMGTANLKAAIEQAMVPGSVANSVTDALYTLEESYAKAMGLSKPAGTIFADNFADENLAIGVTGATFNNAAAVLVSQPEAKPTVSNIGFAIVGTPYYIDLQLQNSKNEAVDGALDVPVVVDMTVPAGMDANKVVVFHFVDGKIETIVPNVYYDKNFKQDSIVFVVDHFSTFAISEVASPAPTSSTYNAFQRYRDNLASEIANAKDGAIIKITRDKEINALPNDIMQALYKKQTVTLVMEYTYNDKEYTVTIPAGKAQDNAIEWYGPLYLQMYYGK